MNQRNILFVGLIVILLFGLFLFRSRTEAPIKQSTVNPTQATSSTNSEKTFELVIKDKKLIGPETISVKVGDSVKLSIISDIADEFHIHGIDKFIDLEKDKSVELKFIAERTGRFIFELEHSKIELGALEILP